MGTCLSQACTVIEVAMLSYAVRFTVQLSFFGMLVLKPASVLRVSRRSFLVRHCCGDALPDSCLGCYILEQGAICS